GDRIRPSATTRQLVLVRWRNHPISAGRLPAQMIKYCENEKYAHSITNASIRFPRSWKCEATTMRSSGGRRLSHTIATMRNDIADRPCPPMISTPYIVEYQCGSSDMSQSNDAK